MAKGFTHESTYNENVEWYTPKPIFNALGIEFDLDPCSPGADIVPWIPARKHLTILDDGLSVTWNGLAFVNPPYGSDTPKWMARLSAHNNGIALIFSRLDTTWAHKYLPSCTAICFIKGRVQFISANEAEQYARGLIKPKGGCGAGSMLVGYGDKAKEILLRSNLGFVMLPAEIKPNRELVRTELQFAGEKVVAQHPTGRPNENLLPAQTPKSAGSLF